MGRSMMMRPGEFAYTIFDTDETFIGHDPWDHFRGMLQPADEEAHITARAFALEGRFEMGVEDGRVVWGGPLLDLADFLAGWSLVPRETGEFFPLEQAPTMSITTIDGKCSFAVAGGEVGSLPLSTTLGTVRAFIGQFAAEIRRHVPLESIPSALGWIRSDWPR
jgi:hypothetical protein